MKALLADNLKLIWGMQERKIIAILSSVADRLIQLSIPELFEILVLLAKYIQIGEDFSGVLAAKYYSFLSFIYLNRLREFLLKEVCLRYAAEFHTTQLKNLKCVMENDLWKRLPLPENYE